MPLFLILSRPENSFK